MNIYEQAVLPFLFGTASHQLKQDGRGGNITMRNIMITEKNIKQVPVDWLCVRYSKIQKQVKTNDSIELIREIKLIEGYLTKIGKSNLIQKHSLTEVQQLELDIPIAIAEQYEPIVEYRLKEYHRKVERKKIIEEELPYVKAQQVHPSKMTASYGNLSGVAVGGITSSSTEAAVMRYFNRIERLEEELVDINETIYPMERALAQLSYDQLRLITAKYFTKENPINESLMQELCWGKQKFYDVKKTALIVIAESLRIV